MNELLPCQSMIEIITIPVWPLVIDHYPYITIGHWSSSMIAPLLLLIPLTLILGGAKWQSVHHTTHKLLHCFSFDSRSIWSLVKLCNKRDTVLRVLCAQSLSLQNIQCVTDGWPEAAFYSGPIWSSIHRQTASAIPILYLGKYGPQLHQTFNHIFDSLSGQDNPFHLWQSCLNRSACVQSFKEHVGRQTFVW